MAEYKSFYKTVGGGEGDRCKYPTRLDMYGCGCQHNCQYCYAKHLLNFRGLWNPQSPAIADRNKVLRTLNKIPSGTILRLGGMTDPFQPLERERGSTKWLIEQLNERNIGYLIVTKSADVADCEVLDKNLAHIQVSITSTDGLAPEGFENASAPSERLIATEKLYAKGFDTRIRLSPYIPQFYNINEILSNGCKNVLFEFLRVNSRILKTMPFIDASGYIEKSGGYYHLPLEVKLKYMEPFIGKKDITVCEDHPDHYAYFKEHINPNKNDCCNLRL